MPWTPARTDARQANETSSTSKARCIFSPPGHGDAYPNLPKSLYYTTDRAGIQHELLWNSRSYRLRLRFSLLRARFLGVLGAFRGALRWISTSGSTGIRFSCRPGTFTEATRTRIAWPRRIAWPEVRPV